MKTSSSSFDDTRGIQLECRWGVDIGGNLGGLEHGWRWKQNCFCGVGCFFPLFLRFSSIFSFSDLLAVCRFSSSPTTMEPFGILGVAASIVTSV